MIADVLERMTTKTLINVQGSLKAIYYRAPLTKMSVRQCVLCMNDKYDNIIILLNMELKFKNI